jgi:hypothetical protein
LAISRPVGGGSTFDLMAFLSFMLKIFIPDITLEITICIKFRTSHGRRELIIFEYVF